MKIELTVNEVYAMQGIIVGLTGLTKQICNDYNVDNLELLNKLEKFTNQWVHANTPT